jgi:hypothetical protein
MKSSCRIPATLSRNWPKDSLVCPIDRVASLATYPQAKKKNSIRQQCAHRLELQAGLSAVPDRHDLKLSE